MVCQPILRSDRLGNDERTTITGFQLCYDKPNVQRALSWTVERGYMHNKIESGEKHSIGHKMAPILVADGAFDKTTIVDRFLQSSPDIDQRVVKLVY